LQCLTNDSGIFDINPGENERYTHTGQLLYGQIRLRVSDPANSCNLFPLISKPHRGCWWTLEGVRKRIPAMPKGQPRESEIRENEFGTFKGTHQRIGMRDRFNIDLFQALDTTVLEGLISDEPAQIDEQMRTFQNRLSAISAKTEKAQPVSVIHQKGTLIVRTAGPDGSLLEVQVSPPRNLFHYAWHY
jgi:hypothetical protein